MLGRTVLEAAVEQLRAGLLISRRVIWLEAKPNKLQQHEDSPLDLTALNRTHTSSCRVKPQPGLCIPPALCSSCTPPPLLQCHALRTAQRQQLQVQARPPL